MTASGDTAQVWDAVTVTDKDIREDILSLAELGEATSGAALVSVAQAKNFRLPTPEQSLATLAKIAAKYPRTSSGLTPLQRLLEWSVSDRRSRTISPLSQETVSEWLENRIKDGTVEGLRNALQVDPANARVTAHLRWRIADQALEQGVDREGAAGSRRR